MIMNVKNILCEKVISNVMLFSYTVMQDNYDFLFTIIFEKFV